VAVIDSICNSEKEKQKHFWKEIKLANRFNFRKETRYLLVSEMSKKFAKKKRERERKKIHSVAVHHADID
jgi:KaiC/GvpD/RAD55 family RecA-like ATPase